MNAIIIDDNLNARIALKSDIEDYCPEINIIGEADGVASAYALLNEHSPELIFLDIRMGDGTGFDLLEKFKPIEDIPFKVIFTTAYDEFALDAFKYAAVDYLLKPIDSDSLTNAVTRVLNLPKNNNNKQLESLLQQISQPKVSKISLVDTERVYIVEIKDIVRCESYKNYTTFTLITGENITVSKTLKKYDTLLANQHFLRVHQSHLVNLNQIKEVVKIDGPYLIMNDKSTVPVSSRKKDVLFQKLKEIW